MPRSATAGRRRRPGRRGARAAAARARRAGGRSRAGPTARSRRRCTGARAGTTPSDSHLPVGALADGHDELRARARPGRAVDRELPVAELRDARALAPADRDLERRDVVERVVDPHAGRVGPGDRRRVGAAELHVGVREAGQPRPRHHPRRGVGRRLQREAQGARAARRPRRRPTCPARRGRRRPRCRRTPASGAMGWKPPTGRSACAGAAASAPRPRRSRGRRANASRAGRGGRCRWSGRTRNSTSISAMPTTETRSNTSREIGRPPRTFSARANTMCPPSSGRNGSRLKIASASEMSASTPGNVPCFTVGAPWSTMPTGVESWSRLSSDVTTRAQRLHRLARHPADRAHRFVERLERVVVLRADPLDVEAEAEQPAVVALLRGATGSSCDALAVALHGQHDGRAVRRLDRRAHVVRRPGRRRRRATMRSPDCRPAVAAGRAGVDGLDAAG